MPISIKGYLTRRKGDYIALAGIVVLSLVLFVHAFHCLGMEYTDNYDNYAFRYYPGLLLKTLFFSGTSLCIVFIGIVLYLLRNKDSGPKWPVFYSNNPIIASICGIIYFAGLILFCIFVAGAYPTPEAQEDIMLIAIAVWIIGIPIDMLGLFLWLKRFRKH